jgi:Ran GTPase-activating protein (RanGAP) involved in mRNA processing and transport
VRKQQQDSNANHIPPSNLKFCHPNTAGAKAVADAVEAGAGIEHLDLSQNKIGSNGAKALADALRDPYAALRVLKLDENAIRDRGAVALGDVRTQVLRTSAFVWCSWYG